jgi:peptidoglycan/LPS O-acetylase OafA/YrhL
MNNGYIRSLDGLRAMAIIMMMSYHFEVLHWTWISMQLFFVLSGFLITGILWNEKHKLSSRPDKFKKFWARRSLRIFPLYFGYLLLLFLTWLFFHFPTYYTTYIPYLLTYTFNFTRTLQLWHFTPLFTHLWSLSVEEQFYFFFPLIMFLCRSRFIKTFMIVVICITPITRLILGLYYQNEGLPVETVADSVYWNTLSHLDAFFIGGSIHVFSLNKKIRRPGVLFFTFLFIGLGAGALEYMNVDSPFPYYQDMGYGVGRTVNYEHVWHYAILNFFFASAILLMVSDYTRTSFGKLRSILEARWLVRIGKVSYGMYVFHWGVLVYVFKRIYSGDDLMIKILLFIPYLALTYGIAELSYSFYESKFLALKDRLFPKKELKRPKATTVNN